MAEINIGNLDVIDSGNIVSVDNLKILVTLGTKNPFSVEMQMIYQENESETRFEGYEIEQVGIGIKFINFTNSLGTGNVTPLRIGWYNGRTLFLNYRIFPINKNKGGIFNYTFLLGQRVDQDGNEIE